MKEKLEERAVVLNQILEEQNTGIQLVYTKQFSDHVYVYRNGNFTTVSEHCIF